MNSKLIAIALCMIAGAALAATQQYYNYPDSPHLYDNARVLVYNNTSGSRNLTGALIKSEVLGGSGPLVKQAPAAASDYARQFEMRDQTGTIKMYINSYGTMVFGTPVNLAVSSVYPANGATQVSNGVWFNYSSTTQGYNYWGRINTTTPTITLNKSADVTISQTYINGSAIPPTATANVIGFANFSGAAGATYTLKFLRTAIIQRDGQTASSCGSAMNDVSGVCQSTFTMK